jgi:hypothetical protein
MSDFQSALTFDPSIADIKSSMTGGRMVILSADAVRSLQEGLYEKFSTGASVILLEMGFSYGSMLFKLLEGNATSTPESEPLTLRYVIQTLFKGGFGKISFTGDSDSGKSLSFLVHNCAFCEASVTENNCNFLRGVLSATMTGLFRRQYKTSGACSVQQNGDHACRIDLVGK